MADRQRSQAAKSVQDGKKPKQARKPVAPERRSWTSMKTRCSNQKSDHFYCYGGRGIKICHRLRNYLGFLEELGRRPGPRYSVDRENNDGHYSCGNCADCKANGWPRNVRWATKKQQMRNTRINRFLTFNGQTFTMSEWAEKTGISLKLLWARLNKLRWSLEKALTEPIHTAKRPKR